jgi:hypothetical protein
MMAEGFSIALIGFVSALGGGALQAWASRSFERHRFFRDNKREIYGHFLSGIAALSVYPPSSAEHRNARAQVTENRCKIALFGSPEVIRTVGLVFNHDNFLDDDAQSALANAVTAMRADTGLKADISTNAQLLNLLFASKGKSGVTWN